jgi:hypothetical protein
LLGLAVTRGDVKMRADLRLGRSRLTVTIIPKLIVQPGIPGISRRAAICCKTGRIVASDGTTGVTTRQGSVRAPNLFATN